VILIEHHMSSRPLYGEIIQQVTEIGQNT